MDGPLFHSETIYEADPCFHDPGDLSLRGQVSTEANLHTVCTECPVLIGQYLSMAPGSI